MATSHREILRASSVIGGASVVYVAVGLVRLKVAALLLGPAGVGLIGLLQNLMTTGASVAALGFGTAGTRQIAEGSSRGGSKVDTARWALFLGSMALAATGGLLFWLFRGPLAWFVLGDRGMSEAVGWVGAGVALAVVAGYQTALLTGLRRLHDLAMVMILSGAVASVAAIAALILLGWGGIVLFVVAVPAALAAIGGLYVARLPRPVEPRPNATALVEQWRTLIQLGAAFTVASASGTVGQLAVRILIQRDLGAEALGLFQASWVISITYVGFILQGMGSDYYPRLASIAHNKLEIVRAVNQQTEVTFLLAGPVLLIMIGAAPWIITLLHSEKFIEAVWLLRLQVLGDVLKLASWPIGYLLMAAGRGRTFMACEIIAILSFVALSAVGLLFLGLEAVGVASIALYAIYLPIVFLIAHKQFGLRWTGYNMALGGALLVGCSATAAAAIYSDVAGALVGLVLAFGFGLLALLRLESALPAPAAAAARFIRSRVIQRSPRVD